MTVRTGPARPPRRGGAAAVEAALLMLVFCQFLFGIFEYSRYLFFVQVGTNAARSGARLAACNADNPAADWSTGVTQITGDPTYADAARPIFRVPGVEAEVLRQLAGAERNVAPLSGASPGTIVQTFPCDPLVILNNPPQFIPAEQPGGTKVWSLAKFPNKFAVRIAGRFNWITPVLLGLVADVPISLVVVMSSEG